MTLRKLYYSAKILRERGVGFFWTYFVESVWFDLRHGTSTSARVPKNEQVIDGSESEADNGLLYVASFTSVTRNTVDHVREMLGDDWFESSQFVDLGCGKGKVLLVFSKLFGHLQEKPAIGIEYDANLSRLAKQNINKCIFAKDHVNVITDSAVNILRHTQCETLIVYLYNSFQGETLRSVLSELENTPHVLIYVDPAEEGMLLDFGYQVCLRNQGRYHADTWLIAQSSLK